MTTFRRIALVLLSLLATSCASSSMRDAVEGKERGTSALYPVPPAKAWSIARSVVFEAAHFDVRSNRERTMILCDAGTGTDTTFIAVWIEPGVDATESRVTIRSVREGGMQFTSVLTEDEFHARFRERLEN